MPRQSGAGPGVAPWISVRSLLFSNGSSLNKCSKIVGYPDYDPPRPGHDMEDMSETLVKNGYKGRSLLNDQSRVRRAKLSYALTRRRGLSLVKIPKIFDSSRLMTPTILSTTAFQNMGRSISTCLANSCTMSRAVRPNRIHKSGKLCAWRIGSTLG